MARVFCSDPIDWIRVSGICDQLRMSSDARVTADNSSRAPTAVYDRTPAVERSVICGAYLRPVHIAARGGGLPRRAPGLLAPIRTYLWPARAVLHTQRLAGCLE